MALSKAKAIGFEEPTAGHYKSAAIHVRPLEIEVNEAIQTQDEVKVPRSDQHGRDSNWEKVRQEVTCAICLELLDDPKSMPCLHTYCKKCLMEALAKRPHNPDLPRDRPAINCPLCRAEVALSNKGIEALPTNFSATRLVETVQLQDKLGQNLAPKCDACKEAVAAASCCDCGGGFFLCTNCIKAHKNLPSTKNHMLITLKDISMPKTSVASVKIFPLCQKHPEELLKLYCQDCEVLVCRDCVLVTHKSHNYSFVDDVIKDEKQQLKDVTLLELDKIVAGTAEAINGVEKMQVNILSHNDQHIAQLNKTFQEITDMMNEHKEALLDKIHQITNESLPLLLKQQDSLSALKRNVEKCHEFTRNTIYTGTNSEIMSAKKQMLQRTKHLKELYDGFQLSPVTKPTITVCYQLGKVNVDIEKVAIFVDLQQCCIENVPDVVFVKETATLDVILKDIEGRPICNAANIFTAAVTTAKSYVTSSVEEVGDGKYSVLFTPLELVEYVVHIQINEINLAKSPLRVLCKECCTFSEDSDTEGEEITNMFPPRGMIVSPPRGMIVSPPRYSFVDSSNSLQRQNFKPTASGYRLVKRGGRY